jgi:3-dehydroquinate synthase
MNGDAMKAETADVVELPQSTVYQQEVTVRHSYAVHFTQDAFAPDNPVFARALSAAAPGRRARFAVFVDANVAACWPALAHQVAAYAQVHGDSLELAGPPESVPGGEQCKNDPTLVTRLLQRLDELAIDRHAYVVGIGGGAVLDLVGYVAAIAHRGVRHVRLPTTVLAQNDSGVGVKNGVNAFGKKNFLGCFAPPQAVINDAAFLRTLHPRDRIAGLAEAVKVALIRDRAYYEWLESNADALREFAPAPTARMIRRCAELHMRQIGHGGDPFERGSARPLDYGHWSAHKLESLTQHELRHGEAVAIGIALDARYSVQCGMLAAGEDERIYRLLKRVGFHLWHPAMERRDAAGRLLVLDGVEEFRQHLGGELSVTLLRGIGVGEEVNAIDCVEVGRAIAWLRRREAVQ